MTNVVFQYDSEKAMIQNIVIKQHAIKTNKVVDISFMRSVISLAALLSLKFYILRFNRNAMREEIEWNSAQSQDFCILLMSFLQSNGRMFPHVSLHSWHVYCFEVCLVKHGFYSLASRFD